MLRQWISRRELFRATGFGGSLKAYLPATLVYRGISFARSCAMIWLLSAVAGQVALLKVAMQVVNILAPIVSLGLTEAITRYASKHESPDRLLRFVRWAGTWVTVVTAISVAIVLMASQPMGRWLFQTNEFPAWRATELMIAVTATLGGIVFYFFVIALLKGLRMFRALAALEVVHGVLFLALSIGAVTLMTPRVDRLMWAYLLAMVVPAAIWMWGLLRQTIEDASAAGLTMRATSAVNVRARSMIVFGVWTAVGGIVWQTWQIVSVWYLMKTQNVGESDALTAVQLIGQTVAIVGAAVIGVVTTSVYRHWESATRDQANAFLDMLTKLSGLALLTMGAAVVASRDLAMLLMPGQFELAGQVLGPVVFYSLACAMLGLISIHFGLLEKTRLTVWAWLAGLVTNGILCAVGCGASSLSSAANAAAWSCVPAMLVALLMVRAEGQPVTRGVLVTLLACGVVLLPMVWMVAATVIIVAAAVATPLFFSVEEKRLIATRIRARLAR